MQTIVLSSLKVNNQKGRKDNIISQNIAKKVQANTMDQGFHLFNAKLMGIYVEEVARGIIFNYMQNQDKESSPWRRTCIWNRAVHRRGQTNWHSKYYVS